MRFIFNSILFFILMGILAGATVIWSLLPTLPSTDTLKDAQMQEPLRVYSREGTLISEFGEQRRVPVKFEDLPVSMIDAFLAAEDDRFFQHPGVDWQGLLRAVILLAKTGEKTQGGSTITMQVAKNFFLSPEKTYTRKLKEILLALKIEGELSKEEILVLYLNKIYLGHRSYGINAAADLYYGKTLPDLTLAQTAMLAGLPKAPSKWNPVSNPQRALKRRNYVLKRMIDLDLIDEPDYLMALETPITAKLHSRIPDTSAPYVAEMVRSHMVDQYGEAAYTSGYRVYTTLSDTLQKAADTALRKALLDYDTRHGYRGAEHHFELTSTSAEENQQHDWLDKLADFSKLGDTIPALVISISEKTAEVFTEKQGLITLEWEGMKWARAYIDENKRGGNPKSVAEFMQTGDVIRLRETTEGFKLTQLPQVQGALVSLSPDDGAIIALAGGFDFNHSKFNRVVQAHRQPGSSFKPFIYSAALEKGYTAASLVNDAPVVFDDPGLEDTWRPENYSGKYFGPTRLRKALTHSRNLISIRLLRSVGINEAIKHAEKFGFDTERLPKDLSLSLGSGTISPLELARGYTVLANGGYLIEPYFISRIESADGEIIETASPLTVCRQCEEDENANYAPQTVDPRNTWIIASMMQDVINFGTGKRAKVLNRLDLSGKTGTTNDQKDAWFSGFNSQIVTTAWVGFDQVAPLGSRETGGRAALPMWVDYMKVALEDMPPGSETQPEGITQLNIDPETGLLARESQKNGLLEYFRIENAPSQISQHSSPDQQSTDSGIPEQLF